MDHQQQVYTTRTTNYSGQYRCTTTTTVCLETRSTTSSRRSNGRRKQSTTGQCEDSASSCRRSGSDKSNSRRRRQAESSPYWASVELFCPNAVLLQEVGTIPSSAFTWEAPQWSSSQALRPSQCSGSPKGRATMKERCRPTSLFGAARGNGRPYAKCYKGPQAPAMCFEPIQDAERPTKKKINKKLLKKRRAKGLPDEEEPETDIGPTQRYATKNTGYRPCRSSLPLQPPTPPSSSSRGFRPLPSPGLLPPMEALPLTDCVDEDELCKWLRDIS